MNAKPSVMMVLAGSFENEQPIVPSSFVQRQIESIQACGWQVILGIVDDRTSPAGIRRNIRRLKREIETARPAIVHAQYGSIVAQIANVIRGDRPLIISFGGDDLLGTPIPCLAWRIREWLARAIGLWAARHASAVVVKSEELRLALPTHLRSKSVVNPNGVDLSVFEPRSLEVCREELGWQPDEFVVLFNPGSASNQVVKNRTLAEAAITLVQKQLPTAHLRLLANVLPDRVPTYLNAANCLLLTSLHEGSPNVVKEAMACNCPVVSVPCGDVVTRLADVTPGGVGAYDAVSLADLIISVYQNGQPRSNGREQLIAQGLDQGEIAKQIATLYAQYHTDETLCAESSPY